MEHAPICWTLPPSCKSPQKMVNGSPLLHQMVIIWGLLQARAEPNLSHVSTGALRQVPGTLPAPVEASNVHNIPTWPWR